MDNKELAETVMPHLFLVTTLVIFVFQQNTQTVSALTVAAIVWLASFFIPRLIPAENTTKIEEELERLNVMVKTNSEISAKELGTIKNVLQIKQMGAR